MTYLPPKEGLPEMHLVYEWRSENGIKSEYLVCLLETTLEMSRRPDVLKNRLSRGYGSTLIRISFGAWSIKMDCRPLEVHAVLILFLGIERVRFWVWRFYYVR